MAFLEPLQSGKEWLMYSESIVFAQLMDFLPRHEFNKCVKRYQGDYRVNNFSCRDQFLCMAFAQLTYRESLRDIETCLRALQPKLYHLANLQGNVGSSRDVQFDPDALELRLRKTRGHHREGVRPSGQVSNAVFARGLRSRCSIDAGGIVVRDHCGVRHGGSAGVIDGSREVAADQLRETRQARDAQQGGQSARAQAYP